MTKREIAEKILREKGCELNLKEIARISINTGIIKNGDIEKLARNFGTVISKDVRKNKNASIFRKVPNGKGGFKKGTYKIKREKKSQQEKIIKNIKNSDSSLIPNVSTLYTGKGGEYAVMSELLFRGYNANIMTVDEGIDIVASKEDKFFYIQVKTTHYHGNKINSPNIKIEKFNQYAKFNTYYVIVIRYYSEKSSRNDFIILRNTDIEKFIATGLLNKDNNTLTLNIKVDNKKIFLSYKGKNEDLTYNFNNFGLIK